MHADESVSDEEREPDGESADGAPVTDDVAEKGHSRRYIIGAGVVGIGAVVAGLVIAESGTSSAIAAGKGTATITWIPAPGSGSTGDGGANPPQPFTGTINGIAVSGISTTTLTASGVESLGNSSIATRSKIQFFRWKGKFGGKPFDLSLSIQVQRGTGTVVVRFPQFKVTGTYAGEEVSAVVAPPSSASPMTSAPIDFHGTAGDWQVSGVL
jgi:hypothetical protein